MKLSVLLFLVFFSAIACKSAKPTSPESASLSDTLALMQKTACFGTCPVYAVTIFSDGKAIYQGDQHVERVGKYQTQLSAKELEAVRELFVKSQIFSFKDQYISNFTDLPTTYLYFSHEGRRKYIEDYYGAPKELRHLEKEFAKLIESYKWRKTNAKAKE